MSSFVCCVDNLQFVCSHWTVKLLYFSVCIFFQQFNDLLKKGAKTVPYSVYSDFQCLTYCVSSLSKVSTSSHIKMWSNLQDRSKSAYGFLMRIVIEMVFLKMLLNGLFSSNCWSSSFP